MPRRPNFQPVQTPKGWMVSVPAAMSAGGKRTRKFFETDKQAEKFAAKIRAAHNSGIRGGMIPAALALDAAEAARILEPYGMSLSDAARDIAKRLGAEDNGETFGERYKRAMIANEGHWSDRYKQDMERVEHWIPAKLMRLRCSLITPETIREALGECGAKAQSTLDNRARYISAILGHKDRHRKSGTIKILNIEQSEAMLQACESDTERMAVALLLWAGIRPDAEGGEIARLDWADVGKTKIYVSPEVAKTNSDRHIPISRRLARLIHGHPKDGCVIPANWKRVYQRIRKTAGVTGQDVTRHTFASHCLAAYGETKAKSAMGHTAGSSTLFRHYRRAVTEADGKTFFR